MWGERKKKICEVKKKQKKIVSFVSEKVVRGSRDKKQSVNENLYFIGLFTNASIVLYYYADNGEESPQREPRGLLAEKNKNVAT